MPPKGKKSAKKKSAKPKSAAARKAGFDTFGMTQEQLSDHVIQLKHQLDREKEERSFYQMERDKVNTFWEITKRQLESVRAEVRGREHEIEEAEERHQTEIRVFKQRVKHLMYEQQVKVAGLKADMQVANNLREKEHEEIEGSLRRDRFILKTEIKERELANDDIMKELVLEKEQEITNLRKDMRQKIDEVTKKTANKLKMLRDELDLRRKTEIHETEELKNSQINSMMRNHEKAFRDIKNYYNDITLNNLALINSLKEQVEELRNKEESYEKQMNEIKSENKRLVEPLHNAKEEVEELKRQLANYNKDKAALASAKARLSKRKKEMKKLEWKSEVLKQQFDEMSKERDNVINKFVVSMNEVKQATGLQNLIVEKKLKALTETLEKKDAQLNEVLAASNLDPQSLASITKKIDGLLESKNVAIKELQYNLARVCKSHNDQMRTYEAKLRLHGIDVDELGFQPVQTDLNMPQMGRGPAGLVSRPL